MQISGLRRPHKTAVHGGRDDPFADRRAKAERKLARKMAKFLTTMRDAIVARIEAEARKDAEAKR